jgi:hypothetical protein
MKNYTEITLKVRAALFILPVLIMMLQGCGNAASELPAGKTESRMATGTDGQMTTGTDGQTNADTYDQMAPGQFGVRGFHVDLRIQIMTMEALRELADELAQFGINTLVMEWEASYPYRNNATISRELAYTREEVASFIDYCEERGIDVIPLQQCFGHVEYILRHDRYSELKEDRKDISQLCPLKEEADSILFADLFADMASMHKSDYIHIGGDETYLLGHCPACSLKAATEGKSKLFVDYMKMMSDIIISLGKKPVMWADILLKYPEAAAEMPLETIYIDWNYGWKTNYFGDITALQEQGLEFWGSPAIRSHPDNAYVTCWEKHFNNQRDFIPYAREAGYTGIIMTSWSTSGVYGFTWDVNYEVMEMEQIRNTYPLSGFRILIASYAQALNEPAPIDPHKFVVHYAADRFGLAEAEGELLWETLTIAPELIVNGRPANSPSIRAMRDTVAAAVAKMKILKASKNIDEFEHLRLMLDLRDHYLAFKEVESRFNSPDFSIDDRESIVAELEPLIRDSRKLDKRFARLNKGFLYDTEIAEQNMIRNRKLMLLHERLTGKRTR